MAFGFDTLVAPIGIVVFFVLSVKILIIDPGKQSRTRSSSKNKTRIIHQRTD